VRHEYYDRLVTAAREAGNPTAARHGYWRPTEGSSAVLRLWSYEPRTPRRIPPGDHVAPRGPGKAPAGAEATGNPDDDASLLTRRHSEAWSGGRSCSRSGRRQEQCCRA